MESFNGVGLGALGVAGDGRRVVGGLTIADNMLLAENIINDQDIDALNFPFSTQPKLDDSGALVFYPISSGFDIFDGNQGTLRLRYLTGDTLACTDPLNPSHDCLAVEPSGSRVYLMTHNGVTVVELDAVPLGVGSVTPSDGPSGTLVQIRGSGFTAGTTVLFNGTAASGTFVDSETLQASVPALAPGPVRITLTNPDASTYSLDAAFTVQ